MKLFTVIACRWFDRLNGNTYHSVRCIRHSDGQTIYGPFRYGYGESYRQTALDEMYKAGWLPEGAEPGNLYMYERENDYPIIWTVSDGLKRDCVANGHAE